MKKYKRGDVEYQIYMETQNSRGIKFILVQSLGTSKLRRKIGDWEYNQWKDEEARRKEGGYYFMWAHESFPLDAFGISPLRDIKNRKMSTKAAIKKFMEVVKNSEKQDFARGSEYKNKTTL